jgi:hypothetical protein
MIGIIYQRVGTNYYPYFIVVTTMDKSWYRRSPYHATAIISFMESGAVKKHTLLNGINKSTNFVQMFTKIYSLIVSW